MFVLAGYYWTENVGDMALREAALSLLGEHLPEQLWAGALGEWFYRPGGPHWDDVQGVVLPGGGLLQDLGGWDEAGWGATSTPAVFWGSLVLEAAARGIPVVAWANGFGPFRSPDALDFSRRVYEATSYHSWRDEGSRSLAGDGAPVTADLALTTGVRLEQDQDAPLAVVLRPFPGSADPAATVEAVGDFLADLGRPVVLIPFEEEDRPHLEPLTRLAGAELSPATGWRAKVEALQGCAGVVTNRFHAALWGLGSGVPVLAMPADDAKLGSSLDLFGSQVRVDARGCRRPDVLAGAWERAVQEVAREEVRDARRRRAAELADVVRDEAVVVARALRTPPPAVDPVVRVLVRSARARREDWLSVRADAERLRGELDRAAVAAAEAQRVHELERREEERSRDAQRAELEAARSRSALAAEDLRRSLDAAVQERDALQSVADDLYRQLQELLGSTAWRAGAPLRAVADARRRASRLVPYVNRRRVSAALRMARQGDLSTLAQRVRATEAVAGAATPSRSRRPLQTRRADPWPVDEPLVTVVIPCFNYGRYVREAVDSVLRQTLGARVEVVVVDGGSTDEHTRSVVAALAADPPPRTRVLLRDDGQRHLVGDNRNVGVEQARGKYVCCLDADDVLHPVYLETAVFLLERCGYDLVSTATRCFGDVTDTFGLLPEPDLQDMLLANNVTTVAVFSKELWRRAGGFHDTGLGAEHIHEDWKLWVRMAALGARIHNIVGQELFLYRVHSRDSLSNTAGVPAMDRQREAVRAFSADLVDEQAVARSRAAREVDVRVEGALDNLLQPGGSRPSVLLALPFLLVGGAERLLSGVVGHLVREGFRVVVVTTLPPEPAFGDTTSWFEDAGAEVFHLARLLPVERWSDFLHHLVGAKQVEVLWLAGSAFTYALLPELRREHPHLQVVDLLFNTVGHVHDNRARAACIDLHLCENPEVEQWLLDQGEPPSKVVRVQSGIDLDRYVPVPRERSPLPLRVGYSGRLSEEKDPLAFLELAELARDPRLHFVMTGAGPLEDEVRRRLARVPHVEHLGVVDDIQGHMASLDLLVVPSRQDGRPLAVLESLALGVPVLATRVGGLPELVRDGETGFTVPVGDVAAMRQVLLRLLEEPGQLEGLRAGARRYAEQHLDVRTMHRAYEGVLRGAAAAASSTEER